mmetsp:Transcript_29471/g.61969  ORF Transcript_29471/g.61969 Transcript_29471/m.61969 type:complete len:306 (+) Transcript_29471:108-1025(+)
MLLRLVSLSRLEGIGLHQRSRRLFRRFCAPAAVLSDEARARRLLRERRAWRAGRKAATDSVRCFARGGRRPSARSAPFERGCRRRFCRARRLCSVHGSCLCGLGGSCSLGCSRSFRSLRLVSLSSLCAQGGEDLLLLPTPHVRLHLARRCRLHLVLHPLGHAARQEPRKVLRDDLPRALPALELTHTKTRVAFAREQLDGLDGAGIVHRFSRGAKQQREVATGRHRHRPVRRRRRHRAIRAWYLHVHCTWPREGQRLLHGWHKLLLLSLKLRDELLHLLPAPLVSPSQQPVCLSDGEHVIAAARD